MLHCSILAKCMLDKHQAMTAIVAPSVAEVLT